MRMNPLHERELYRLFSSVKDEKDAKQLLKDILTPKELASAVERWQIMKELSKGSPQREISKKLGVSISKITRGSRLLQEGGFRDALKKKN